MESVRSISNQVSWMDGTVSVSVPAITSPRTPDLNDLGEMRFLSVHNQRQ